MKNPELASGFISSGDRALTRVAYIPYNSYRVF